MGPEVTPYSLRRSSQGKNISVVLRRAKPVNLQRVRVPQRKPNVGGVAWRISAERTHEPDLALHGLALQRGGWPHIFPEASDTRESRC